MKEESIPKRESETVELKESLADIDDIVEHVCAFANRRGGAIFIGVRDDGKVVGVDIGRQTIEQLTNKIVDNTDHPIYPKISSEEIGGKKVIVIKVDESTDKPHTAFGKPWIRVGKNKKQMKIDEYRRLLLAGAEVKYDSQAREDATLKDIDFHFVKNFFIPLYESETGKRVAGTPIKLLEGLGCVKNNKPTNAGILLFGKNPQKFFPNSYIALVRYKGKAVTGEALDRKEFTSNLFQQIDECDKYIKGQIATMSKLLPDRVRRMDIPEYPLFSIREAITNAVVHRSHLEQHTKVIIKMFDDRIEIYNPGGLPKGITPKNITKKQFSRNPTITGVLSKVKYIEEVGEGWDKIIEEHRKHPLRPKLPKISSDAYTTTVTLYSTKEKFAKLKIGRPEAELNERQIRAIDYAKEKGSITRSEYVSINKISHTLAHMELKELVEKRFFVQKGRGRATKYLIRG